jgi:hypothetical protein
MIVIDGGQDGTKGSKETLGERRPAFDSYKKNIWHAHEFDHLVSRYYCLKGKEQNLSSDDINLSGNESSEAVAQKLLEMPLSEPRQVLLKLNILDNELTTDMDCAETVGRKHLLIFAALKADIIEIMASAG